MATSGTKRASSMEWTTTHDVLLCREVLVVEFYRHKKGSNERGRAWTKIAENLNNLKEVRFRVTQRAVRERFDLLQEKFKRKMKDEEKASGISPEKTEVDSLLEEITERETLAQSTMDSAKGKVDSDRKTAEDMRILALESIGEIRKRNADGDMERKRKQRRSGGETIEFLRDKSAKEMKFREEELALRKKEQENEATRLTQMFRHQETILDNMAKQQQQIQALELAFLQQQQKKKNV